jgi:beta-lactam-binding protein with PASTA domain
VAAGAVRAQATVVVPNVVGENVGVAISQLQALGFGLGFKQFNDNLCAFDPFEVTKQSPAAGTSVAPGSTVTLTFAVRPAPPRVCP